VRQRFATRSLTPSTIATDLTSGESWAGASETGPGEDLAGDDRRDRNVDHEAKRRPPPRVGDEVGAMLPEVLQPVSGKAGDEQPRRPGDRCRGDDDEPGCDPGLDGENQPAPVGHREPDVDGRDRGQAERVDGRGVEPPEGERGGRLGDADDEPPDDRPAQPSADRVRSRRDGQALTSKLNIIPLSWCSAM
jgi:hypothetical protein